jgi:hypothetical protein
MLHYTYGVTSLTVCEKGVVFAEDHPSHAHEYSFACMSSLACGRPGDSALLLACMFGVLLLFHMSDTSDTVCTMQPAFPHAPRIWQVVLMLLGKHCVLHALSVLPISGWHQGGEGSNNC